MMGVRIFLSNGSGNKEIENNQQRIRMVLTTRNIEFVTIDISAPGMQDMRTFMRMNGRKREGQRNVLPPQIFNGEEYRGDYEGFDIANEDDDLEEFLGIPRKCPKAEPVKTGAVAPEVGKLNPGKLAKEEKEEDNKGNEMVKETEEVENKDTFKEVEEEYENSTDCENSQIDQKDVEVPVKNEECNDDVTLITSNEPEDGSYSDNDNDVKDETLNDNDLNDESLTTESESLEDQGAEFVDWKQSVEEEALQTAANIAAEKTDGLNVPIKENDRIPETDKNVVIEDTSSDESSDEDTAVEYMPDGELVRKKSRGFKQLNNCKRFWKASLMVE